MNQFLVLVNRKITIDVFIDLIGETESEQTYKYACQIEVAQT